MSVLSGRYLKKLAGSDLSHHLSSKDLPLEVLGIVPEAFLDTKQELYGSSGPSVSGGEGSRELRGAEEEEGKGCLTLCFSVSLSAQTDGKESVGQPSTAKALQSSSS